MVKADLLGRQCGVQSQLILWRRSELQPRGMTDAELRQVRPQIQIKPIKRPLKVPIDGNVAACRKSLWWWDMPLFKQFGG